MCGWYGYVCFIVWDSRFVVVIFIIVVVVVGFDVVIDINRFGGKRRYGGGDGTSDRGGGRSFP